MGCCHSHSHSGEKKRDTPPSGSSLPLELDDCSRKPHARPRLRSTGTSRHSPPLPPVVAAGRTDSSKSPPFLEEEAVKEVIPESANRRSSPLPSSFTPNAAWFPPQPPDLRTPPSNLSQVDRVVKINVGDEETSEIYSASESLSTSKMQEEDDDWGDHRMNDRDRDRDRDRDPRAEQSPMSMFNDNTWTSPSKFQRRSRGGGKCTNSSTSPSPTGGGGDDSAAYSCSPNSSSRRLEEGGTRRRVQDPRRPLRGGSRSAGGRQMGGISRNVAATPGPEDRRSGRIRSRSPAMRSGHNSSMGLGRTPQNADAGEGKNQGGGEADSLDNPIVSLECFIFL